MTLIQAKNLVKVFKISERSAGMRGAMKGLFSLKRKEICAVDDVSINISEGEMVGYLGPNGAGKSTTIKMLCGILHPTSGRVEINGICPQENRRAVVQNIGVVFGQRTQLYWDLRLGESFELLRRVYRIKDSVFHENVDWMKKEFGLAELLNTPVRQLSLGQRMRGEISAALLHSPSVLFLDEPTIGLDLDAKNALRNLIRKINRERNITVILTTHDLMDVEALCRRLVVINHGRVVEDGQITQLMERLVPFRILEVEMEKPLPGGHVLDLVYGDILETQGCMMRIRFNQNHVSASEAIGELLQHIVIRDLKIREPEVEEMVRAIYQNSYRSSYEPRAVI